jgi:hypothetical protein
MLGDCIFHNTQAGKRYMYIMRERAPPKDCHFQDIDSIGNLLRGALALTRLKVFRHDLFAGIMHQCSRIKSAITLVGSTQA